MTSQVRVVFDDEAVWRLGVGRQGGLLGMG